MPAPHGNNCASGPQINLYRSPRQDAVFQKRVIGSAAQPILKSIPAGSRPDRHLRTRRGNSIPCRVNCDGSSTTRTNHRIDDLNRIPLKSHQAPVRQDSRDCGDRRNQRDGKNSCAQITDGQSPRRRRPDRVGPAFPRVILTGIYSQADGGARTANHADLVAYLHLIHLGAVVGIGRYVGHILPQPGHSRW